MTANTQVQAFKKGLIVQTARRLFCENPFESVTIEQIAKEAGFGKSTLYMFFKSKEELLAAVIKLGLETLNDEFHKISGAEISAFEAIKLLIPLQYEYFSAFNSSLAFTYFQKGASACIDSDWRDEIARLSSQKSAQFAHLLQRGIQEGDFIESDPEYLAWFIISLIKGVCMPSLSRKSELRDKKEDLKMLQRVILQGILVKD